MSQDYNFWSMSYKFKWCTKEQLEEAEQQGQITQLELNQILGVTMPDNSQVESKQSNNTQEEKNINTNNDLVLPRG